MKAADIHPGRRYWGKVGTRVVVVEVVGRARFGTGWRVRSLLTGYETDFRTAQKFRSPASDEDVASMQKRAERPRLVASHVIAGHQVKVKRHGRDYLLFVDGEQMRETFRSKKVAVATARRNLERELPVDEAVAHLAERIRDGELIGGKSISDEELLAPLLDRDYFRAHGSELDVWVEEGDAKAVAELERRQAKRAAKHAAVGRR